jgi:hypothetical protein
MRLFPVTTSNTNFNYTALNEGGHQCLYSAEEKKETPLPQGPRG